MVARKRAIEKPDSARKARRNSKTWVPKSSDMGIEEPMAAARNLSAILRPAKPTVPPSTTSTCAECGTNHANTEAGSIRAFDSDFDGSSDNIISNPGQALTEINAGHLGDYHVSNDESIRLWREDIRPSEKPQDERGFRRVAEIESRARAITAVRLAELHRSLEARPEVSSPAVDARSQKSSESSVTDVSLIVSEPAVRRRDASASSVMTDEPLIVVEPTARQDRDDHASESSSSEMSFHENVTQPQSQGNQPSGTRPRRRASASLAQNDPTESRTEDAAIDLLEANLTNGDIELTPEIRRFLEDHGREIPIVEPMQLGLTFPRQPGATRPRTRVPAPAQPQRPSFYVRDDKICIYRNSDLVHLATRIGRLMSTYRSIVEGLQVPISRHRVLRAALRNIERFMQTPWAAAVRARGEAETDRSFVVVRAFQNEVGPLVDSEAAESDVDKEMQDSADDKGSSSEHMASLVEAEAPESGVAEEADGDEEMQDSADDAESSSEDLAPFLDLEAVESDVDEDATESEGTGGSDVDEDGGSEVLEDTRVEDEDEEEDTRGMRIDDPIVIDDDE